MDCINNVFRLDMLEAELIEKLRSDRRNKGSFICDNCGKPLLENISENDDYIVYGHIVYNKRSGVFEIYCDKCFKELGGD